MERSIATYRAQAAEWQSANGARAPIYFDRGIGDAFTCADLIGHTLSDSLIEQAKRHRYRDPVFLAPWWPEIYATDNERRQSREEAERTEHAVAQTYTELGYRIVRLPLISPAERAEFILRHSILRLSGLLLRRLRLRQPPRHLQRIGQHLRLRLRQAHQRRALPPPRSGRRRNASGIDSTSFCCSSGGSFTIPHAVSG